jgi:hypothetical protein
MKKILVAVLALASVSAFANHKNLVSFDGDTLSHFANYVTGSRDGKNGNADQDTDSLDLTVNYAWSVHSNIFVGAILGFSKSETDVAGAKEKEGSFTYGLRAIYDLSTDHANSMYVSLAYVVTTPKYVGDNVDTTTTAVEFGKRYSMFTVLAGPNVTFSPSIAYSMVSEGSALDTDGGSDIRLNLVKFDVLF